MGGETVAVYADVLFGLNFVMNGFILWLTAWLLGAPYSWPRLAAAAAAASLYVIGGFWRELAPLYHPLAKLAVSCGLVYLAFGRRSGRSYWLLLGTFYLTSFVLGGAVAGWLYFWRETPAVTAARLPVGAFDLLGGALIGGALVAALVKRLAARRLRGRDRYALRIGGQGRTLTVCGFLDTGNQLYTTPGRRPVIVADRAALRPLLSPAANAYLDATPPPDWCARLAECADEAWLARVEMIPYHSVGGRSVLLAFRPDCIRIASGDDEWSAGPAAVAVFAGVLSAAGEYEALLHPALLRQAKEKGEAGKCA